MNELLEAGEGKGAALARFRDQAIPADMSAWGVAQRKPQALPTVSLAIFNSGEP
ncbi:MAG: hypothetical protein JO139_01605 [Alphaproteobacteria bacterium]|nr:hypothetical protein [Alphaproteobacteria bacterium]